MRRMSDRLQALHEEYAQGARRPLKGYLGLLAGYGVAVGALVAAARFSRRTLPRPGAGDVLLITAATYKTSRLLTKDAVTSPLRAPFTRYDKPIGAGEVQEEVRDEAGPARHALGELVSCPFCLSVWVATGLTGGLVLAPRFTRLAATALTAVAGADFLQLAYAIAHRHAEGGPKPAPAPLPAGFEPAELR
ncbi:DUF1360 domain-containing protein [Catellatospora sp. IY07-71]|uniref:DUF1360 domain-containing protein n=1 Tax=Catellatospora sp. IY07-71 TaxID=2728827 RepID=UPI0035304E82